MRCGFSGGSNLVGEEEPRRCGPGAYRPAPAEGSPRLEDLPAPPRMRRQRHATRPRWPPCGPQASRAPHPQRLLPARGALRTGRPQALQRTSAPSSSPPWRGACTRVPGGPGARPRGAERRRPGAPGLGRPAPAMAAGPSKHHGRPARRPQAHTLGTAGGRRVDAAAPRAHPAPEADGTGQTDDAAAAAAPRPASRCAPPHALGAPPGAGSGRSR